MDAIQSKSSKSARYVVIKVSKTYGVEVVQKNIEKGGSICTLEEATTILNYLSDWLTQYTFSICRIHVPYQMKDVDMNIPVKLEEYHG